MMSMSLKKCACAIWGFAEATLFFILPDVLLSYFALDKKIKMFSLTIWALTGAIIGGVVMYSWGMFSPEAGWNWVESVPAINTDMMNTVVHQLKDLGAVSIIMGPFQGLPYKVYAVQAAYADIGIIEFLLMSVVARLFRFLLIAYIARGVSVLLMTNPRMTKRGVTIIWLIAWVTVYVFYFYHFPS